MTATLQPESKSSSRRALLAGALGGLGALAASAFARPSVTRAHDVDDVWLGHPNSSNFHTIITNAGDAETVFSAVSTHGGIALHGNSASGYAVFGESASGTAVVGSGTANVGVYGITASSGFAATVGRSDNNGTGVLGASQGGGPAPAAKAKTGVYGYAIQDTSATGVSGESTIGVGVRGKATTGYAGYFDGRVFTTRYYELTEIATPNPPVANRARLFVRDSAGKTQLAVKFPNGTVRVLATEA